MCRIILASESPRRKKLLSQLGFAFDVIPSNIHENTDGENPQKIAEILSEKKAENVAQNKTNSLIIGADTIVLYKNEILGKPENEKQAEGMLLKLSDTFHYVYTGVTLIRTNGKGEISSKRVFSEQTKVIFSALSQQEINAYIQTGSPFDKAGAYGIQDDLGAVFIKRIEGDYYNVVGFPINRFYNEMKSFYPDLALFNPHV